MSSRYSKTSEAARSHREPKQSIVAITGLSLALTLVSTACTAAGRTATTITQPEVTGLTVAPDRQRVDLDMPTFSDSTNITNALFPVSSQRSVLLVG